LNAKLIFDSRQNQAIDRERKCARRRGRGTTLRISAVDQAQGRRQGDAEGGERERGGGARGRAQQEALAVLCDLGLGERVEIGDDVGPGSAGALGAGGEAIFHILLTAELVTAAPLIEGSGERFADWIETPAAPEALSALRAAETIGRQQTLKPKQRPAAARH
jgi:hypothetical protein